MKKLIIYIIFTLIIPSALAERPNPDNDRTQHSVSLSKRRQSAIKECPTHQKTKRTSIIKETEGLKSLEDFVGEYEWLYNDLLETTTDMSLGVLKVSIADAETNTLSLDGFISPELKVAPIKATVDLEKGTFTIPNLQDLGRDANGDITFFYIKGFSESGMIATGASDIPSSVGTISEGRIVFPELEVWAWGDPEDEELGYWVESAYNSFDIIGDPDEGWESWGSGVFADGWMYPGFDMDPFVNMYSVDIERLTGSEGIYRIKNPYYGHFKYSAQVGSPGWIVFNISDRDFVTVTPFIRAGFTVEHLSMCCTNIAGFFIANGFTKEEIKNEWNDMEWSSYSKGTVTFNDCRLNVKGRDSYMVWEDGMPVPMKGYLQFERLPLEYENEPGDVIYEIEDEEYSVEYFNLQGLKVSPDSSGILIRRHGSEIEKVCR